MKIATGTPQTKKYPYPKSIGFIITNEFCERFSFYGMRTILVLYLKDKLLYDEDDSIVIYHIFTMLVYFFPIFGAMIADSWLGRFKTIFSLSIIYALGNILLSLTAMEPLNIPMRAFTIIGLLLVAIGTGGIKPCVSAFGGDQFKLPQQAAQLATFFSLFYFSINAGSFISTFITPILRVDVKCFGYDDCYSLAFGVPGILMIFSIVVFILGKSLYVIKKPAGNVLLEVSKCIGHAISRRQKTKKVEQKPHWLDYADDTFDIGMINDIKAALKVLVLFIPLPVFWALFDQQGSRWTFQATRMDGTLGSFILKPDQMQVVNPLLILLFIPMFEVAIYPALKWCKIIRKPLHKMILGGILASIAFVVSGIVELELMKTYPVLPTAGISQLRMYNGNPYKIEVESSVLNGNIEGLGMIQNMEVKNFSSIPFTLNKTEHSQFDLTEKTAISYFINKNLTATRFVDDSDKTSKGYPAIRFLVNSEDEDSFIFLTDMSTDSQTLKLKSTDLGRYEISPSNYEIKLGNTSIVKDVQFNLGGVYAIVISDINGNSAHKVIEIVKPNSIHMLWLLPQYIIITMAEVMFSVTGLEFSFTQAPSSMKSVLTAGWLLTVAFGNLIVVIVAEAKGLESQADEFFLFAGLMLADILIFWLMTLKYVYIQSETSEIDVVEDTDNQPEKLGLENLAYKEDPENDKK